MRLPLFFAAASVFALLWAQPVQAQDAPLNRAWPPTDAQPAEFPSLPPETPQSEAVPSSLEEVKAGEYPAWMAKWTRIVFQSARDGNWEIYSALGNGSSQRRLTWTPEDEGRPRFSPDGMQIAFDADADADGTLELWIMQADGSGRTLLVDSSGSDYAPAWSVDGTHLVFTSTRNGSPDVFDVSLETGAQSVVAATPLADFDPVFNPTSGELFWIRQIDATGGVVMGLLNGVERIVHGRYIRPQRLSVDNAGTHIAMNHDAGDDGWLDMIFLPFDPERAPWQTLAWRGDEFTYYEPYLNKIAPLSYTQLATQYVVATWRRMRQSQPYYLAALRIVVVAVHSERASDYQWTISDQADAWGDWRNIDRTPPVAHITWGPYLSVWTDKGKGSKYVYHDEGGTGIILYEWQAMRDRRVIEGSSSIPLMPMYGPMCKPGWTEFRVLDQAGMWSPWSARRYFLIARSRSKGLFTDVRNIGIPGIPVIGVRQVDGGPPLTGADGRYVGLVCTENPILQAQQPEAFLPPAPYHVPGQYNSTYGPEALLPVRGMVFREGFGSDADSFERKWTHSDHVGLGWLAFEENRNSFDWQNLLVLGYKGQGLVLDQPVVFWARSIPRATSAPVEDQHELTLALDVAVEFHGAEVGSGVPLTVSVQTSMWPTATALLTASLTNTEWQHLWTEMPLPVGRLITVTVAVEARAGITVPSVLVDNVVIASWWSPRITEVALLPEAGLAGTVVRVTGENFLPPLSARAGGQEGTVNVIDDSTLEVAFASPLLTGQHTLYVTNQAGSAQAVTTAAPEKIRFGQLSWLPVVSRE